MVYDAVGNVTDHLALSGFPPSPGAVLHQDTHTLRLQVGRPIMAPGAPSTVGSKEMGVGRAGTPTGEGESRRADKGGGGLPAGGAGL